MNLYEKSTKCSGCGACLQVCPKSAISMEADAIGFLYPKINAEHCIDCSACRHVCPYQNLKKLSESRNDFPSVYALQHKSSEILAKSSSGGAFTAIVQALNPDIIYGASWDSQWGVHHIEIIRGENLDLLRKSKYVQSDTGKTFKSAKNALLAGKTVLYSGTPCQIAALRSFLEKDYDNLYTCDLICEGVQNYQFWKSYLNFMQTKFCGKVTKVEFRDKSKHGWERSDFCLEFDGKKEYRKTSQTKDSAFMNSFIFQGGNRDSCYECPFASIPRQGDFTIGDLWGWRKIAPEWSNNKGLSVVLFNTEKARQLMPALQSIALIKETTLEDAAHSNPNILKCTVLPHQRALYLRDMKNLPFVQLEKKWLRPRNLLRRVLSGLKYIIVGKS